MSSTAIVLGNFSDASYDAFNQHIMYSVPVFYCNTEGTIAEGYSVFLRVPPDSTANQIENILVDAIIEYATANYPSLDLQRNECIIPDFKRGQ